MDKFGSGAVAVFGLFAVIAVVAVIVSQRAQTTAIIQALGAATGGVINASTAPLNAKSQ